MTLQSASDAVTASDAANIETRAVLTSLTMAIIGAGISYESTRTDHDWRTYRVSFNFEADVNGRTEPVEIIQSDDSRILLTDLEKALVASGYRTSSRSIKTRSGKPDKVKLTVAWG